MSLSSGTMLGVYEVLAPIGKGGMGEVYRARDTKLGREVAIKVLPDELSKDRERLLRFAREAKLLASLNHPAIATLYGFEDGFLVMELVEGETLADRIARSARPVDEALPLFTQIAEGLEAAHEQGVIHRDLKPPNIKITPDGKIKILDFGLAKAFVPEGDVSAETSHSPTLTKGTALGAIMGTASYMSPEQARGETVDERTDIWAFGCCLYEALSGKKSFDGETVTDILAAVVHEEPAWERLPSSTPASLARLLRRCFAKNPRQRLHHVGDARLELEDAPTESAPALAPATTSRGSFALGAVALASLAIAVWSLTRTSDVLSGPLARYAISLPANQELLVSGAGPAVAISPDGQTFAWIGRSGGTQQIYLRRAGELEAQQLAGTEGARDVFFSPDGQWLGFTNAEWLMKISTSGGAPTRITEQRYSRGATWASDGSIVFSDFGGLHKVSAEGGTVASLATPDRERREKGFRFPDVLPDGNAVVFTVGDAADMETWDEGVISVLSLETGEAHTLVNGGTNARYSPTGHLIYALGDRLLAAPFDVRELAVTGPPVPIVEGVSTQPINGTAKFAISRGGSLLYAPGGEWERRHRVVSVDRAGRSEPLIESPGEFWAPDVSPDGEFLALSVNGANVSIWIYSFSRDTVTRLVSGFNNLFPTWSPDGRRLAFGSDPGGIANLFSITADGSGQPEALLVSKYMQRPESWSQGGGFLLYVQTNPDTGRISVYCP